MTEGKLNPFDAEFFGKMFPGSKVEIHRVEMPKRNPRDKEQKERGNNGKE